MHVKLLSKEALTPKRSTHYSAGYDLYSPISLTIEPNTKFASLTRVCINLDISLSVPNDHYGRIAPRSSMSMKGIDVGAGVIEVMLECF